ncbi:MAG: hypothetical protein WCB18_09405, partial [Thermoplasmata archaeon]
AEPAVRYAATVRTFEAASAIRVALAEPPARYAATVRPFEATSAILIAPAESPVRFAATVRTFETASAGSAATTEPAARRVTGSRGRLRPVRVPGTGDQRTGSPNLSMPLHGQGLVERGGDPGDGSITPGYSAQHLAMRRNPPPSRRPTAVSRLRNSVRGSASIDRGAADRAHRGGRRSSRSH